MVATDLDVLAELDEWLDQPAYEEQPRRAMAETAPLVRRARDEIMALRKENDAFHARCSGLIAEKIRLRFAALEEAAQEAGKWATGKAARSAIRALKDKPP